jgi:predicted transcriptional regulator
LDEGLRQIAEGKLIPHEEVKEEFSPSSTVSDDFF